MIYVVYSNNYTFEILLVTTDINILFGFINERILIISGIEVWENNKFILDYGASYYHNINSINKNSDEIKKELLSLINLD